MNPQRARPDWPPAVIAGAYRTGVLAVRTLTRRGVRATSFDCNQSYPGFRSVYGRAHVSPDPDTNPEAWVTFMKELSQRIGRKPVLISSADQFTSAIAIHAERLRDHYILSPGARLQGLLSTKETQYELAATHGMPMPVTRFVRSEPEVAAFAAKAQFPCLLKPIHFREWQRFPEGHPLSYAKIWIARNQSELLAGWRLAAVVNPAVIAQEIIDGPDTGKRVYLSCYDAHGERIANAMFRELRCNPMGFGPATVTEPVVDADTDRVCDRFLRSVGYSGICEIEMKRDSRDGQVKLIEVNPRLTGGGDAAPYAGVDLCWIHYLDLIGQKPTAVSPDARDFRHIDLRSDVSAIFAYRRAGLLGWRDLFRSYRGPRAFIDFDTHDWRYSLETLYRMARTFARESIRSLRNPSST